MLTSEIDENDATFAETMKKFAPPVMSQNQVSQPAEQSDYRLINTKDGGFFAISNFT